MEKTVYSIPVSSRWATELKVHYIEQHFEKREDIIILTETKK